MAGYDDIPTIVQSWKTNRKSKLQDSLWEWFDLIWYDILLLVYFKSGDDHLGIFDDSFDSRERKSIITPDSFRARTEHVSTLSSDIRIFNHCYSSFWYSLFFHSAFFLLYHAASCHILGASCQRQEVKCNRAALPVSCMLLWFDLIWFDLFSKIIIIILVCTHIYPHL